MKGVEGLVSCVTPVYNGENYLGGMLDSLLEQTYPNVELILVDDGSTDRTLELAEGYLARFAQKGYDCRIIHAPHQNASAALNRGLALVRGEYLIWPDSDDVLQPESIQKRVDFLREHPDYHCVRSLMYYFGGNAAQGKQAESVGSLEKEDLFFDLLEGRTFVCCGCYMLKTEDFFPSIRSGVFRSMRWVRIFKCFCPICTATGAQPLRSSCMEFTCARTDTPEGRGLRRRSAFDIKILSGLWMSSLESAA